MRAPYVVRFPGQDAVHHDRGIRPAVPTTGRGPRSCLVHNGPPAGARNALIVALGAAIAQAHGNGQAMIIAHIRDEEITRTANLRPRRQR
jgi:hypothetical protein